MLRRYPKTIEGIDHRHINYQASIDLSNRLEKEGRALIFAPSRHLPLGTFSRDAALEQKLSDYEAKRAALQEFLKAQGHS
jgi:predicted patatin/cPLA2 family phospholipase